jgi:hypothetical protein
MCLSYISERRIAQEPILVYKCGFDKYKEKKIFCSKYISHYSYKKGLAPTIPNFGPTKPLFNPLEIEEGYHSYQKFKACLKRSGGSSMGLFIIPKGTAYYEGMNHDGTRGYASEAIYFVGFLSILNYLKALWLITK